MSLNPLNDIAKKLLEYGKQSNYEYDDLLYSPGEKGGRIGQGGPIGQTPFIEVATGPSAFDEFTGGDDGGIVKPRFLCYIYMPSQQADTERSQEVLDGLHWSFRRLVRDDCTLGGLVEIARVNEWDAGLTIRNDKPYWYKVIFADCEFEETWL